MIRADLSEDLFRSGVQIYEWEEPGVKFVLTDLQGECQLFVLISRL